METPEKTPEGDGKRLDAEIRTEAERLFEALLDYCEASRNYWWQLSKEEQRDFFQLIFNAAWRLEDLVRRCKPFANGFALTGPDGSKFERGRERIRRQLDRFLGQYVQGVECIVAGIRPPDFEPEAEVKRPDFRPFLSPLRGALKLMGSSVAETPEESWWNEPVKPDPLNPWFAVFRDILERRENEPVEFSEYRPPKEWRALLADAKRPNSETTWRNLRGRHPDEIEGEPGKGENSVRVSRRLASQWDLKLPEFE